MGIENTERIQFSATAQQHRYTLQKPKPSRQTGWWVRVARSLYYHQLSLAQYPASLSVPRTVKSTERRGEEMETGEEKLGNSVQKRTAVI